MAKSTTKNKKTNTAPIFCIWSMDTECEGPVDEKTIFYSQADKMPMCEKHFKEHKDIMILFKNGYDIEEIMKQDANWRRQEVLTLQLSGVENDDEVEI